MSVDLSRLNPLPAGFGQCGKCAYRDTGTPAICFACFRQRCRADTRKGCRACGSLDLYDGDCGNPLCNNFRWYDTNYTISYREGVLENRMNAYKFQGSRGWGLIFARALLGFLDEHWVEFLDYDLFVASPAFIPVGSGDFDHTRFVIETAAQMDPTSWPFDTATPHAIVKTRPTQSMKRKNWRQRDEIATTDLREALAIPDAVRVKNKKIVVFDDLYTTGHTLNEVARCLRRVGRANRVTGLSLARQLHRPP